jgi:phage terminase large subunit-like protein
MNGYVKNKGMTWRHAMKRSVGPGHQIPLDELFEQYGEKHDLKEGEPFVEWLRSVKLRDTDTWEIVYKDGVEKDEKSERTIKEKQASEMIVPHVKKGMEVAEVVQMSVRTARTDLKKITDIKLLKYALQEANQLSNKDTLVRMLRKRIQELEITRR